MCPKLKPQKVILHRFELQQTERDTLEMVAASITARNVTTSINSLLTPFTQASVAGISFAIALVGAIGLASEAQKLGVTKEDVAPFFLGIIPGSFAYGIRNINWNNLQNEFDKRMKNMNPPSI